VLADVLAECMEEPHRVRPRRAHHHRLGLSGKLVCDVRPEVLDDDLGLLRQVVLAQGDEPRDRLACLGGLVARVVRQRLLQVVVGAVRRVGREDVVDEIAWRIEYRWNGSCR
jgi:hypothetical protein